MSADAACHELLLRLAGRLPDRRLWRFRDWLAAGAREALAGALPRTLLRERVPVTVRESRLLSAGLVDAGADPGLLNALPWVDEPGELNFTFSAEAAELDSPVDPAAVMLGAILQGRPALTDVRGTWRRHRFSAGPAARIVLVTTTSSGESPLLTGELQRVLRALGVHEPSVEVIPDGIDMPSYHKAALAASEPLLPGIAYPATAGR